MASRLEPFSTDRRALGQRIGSFFRVVYQIRAEGRELTIGDWSPYNSGIKDGLWLRWPASCKKGLGVQYSSATVELKVVARIADEILFNPGIVVSRLPRLSFSRRQSRNLEALAVL